MTTQTETIPLGNVVICDLCNTDYTTSPITGGFIFGSSGVCPACAPEFRKSVEEHHEEDYIIAECPPHQSFADFIRTYRGPGAVATITAFDTLEELLDAAFKR
jgi:hypothetical protein